MIQLIQNKLNLLLGLILSLGAFGISYYFTSNKQLSITLAIAILMFTWWISEALPFAITALIPICLFPVFNVMSIDEVTRYYSNKIIFLMLAGFLLGLVLQKWNLNYRIALNILKVTGNKPYGIILGFMLATAFLSMWISNTASTLIMLPIGLSFLKVADQKNDTRFALILMISIAYSASIGGISTIIGTPTNAILVSFLDELYNIEFSFAKWFLTFFPLTLLLILILWLYLGFFKLRGLKFPDSLGKKFINNKITQLGKVKFEEKSIIVIFILLALSWVFKSYFPFKISDSAIGLIFCSLFFIIPSKNSNKTLLEWSDTKELSWGTLILFGGGLALAKGLEKTGVINLVSDLFMLLEIKSYLVALIFVTFVAVFLTELMSNLALITILAPILMILSFGFTDSPTSLAIPATLAASCAFMLPMATPPNAIVMSSGLIHVRDMIKVGLVANLVSMVAVVGYSYLVLK
jgi:sodium-dependent dicarboxylate transporter 2/3/5